METDQHLPLTKGRTIRWARCYDAVVAVITLGRAPAVRRLTADLAGVAPGDSVLDVGCGTGDVTMLLRERAGAAGRVAGIDAAPEMIEVARKKARRSGLEIDYQVAAVEDLPFADNTFDVAVSSLMLHHLPGALKGAAMREVLRVLKPGGHLLIVDLAPANGRARHLSLPMLVHRRARPHRHAAPKRTTPPTPVRTDDGPTVRLLEAAGFTDIDSGGTRFSYLAYARGRKST